MARLVTVQYTNASEKQQLTHTHSRLTALCPGLPGWASTGKVKPIWILLKQQTVSGSGISWATCKSTPRCRQITTPAPHQSVFTGRMPFLPPNQQRQSIEGTVSCDKLTTTPAPHHSVFYGPDALPTAQPTASKHWMHRSFLLTWWVNMTGRWDHILISAKVVSVWL